MKTVKGKIAELRQKTNTTQKELAAHLGVSESCLSLWETGQRQISLINLKKIAEYFNVSLDYLTGLSEIEGNLSDLTNEELELMELIKELDDNQLKALSVFVDFLVAQRK